MKLWESIWILGVTSPGWWDNRFSIFFLQSAKFRHKLSQAWLEHAQARVLKNDTNNSYRSIQQKTFQVENGIVYKNALCLDLERENDAVPFAIEEP